MRWLLRLLMVGGCALLSSAAFGTDQSVVFKAPPPAAGPPPPPQMPCSFGGMLGGGVDLRNSVNSTSGFYLGNANSRAVPYLGGFADCTIGPSGLSLVPTLGLSYSRLPFTGTGGGVPVISTGHLTELDTLLLLKLTKPLNQDYNISFFGGPGIATLWPGGQPTGPGGPSIIGSRSALALRTGIEISRALKSGFSVGVQTYYQHTNSTTYDSTLPGEGFRFGPNDSIMVGLTVACCNPPPPPATSTVERITPPPKTEEKPKTPPPTTGGDVVTYPKKKKPEDSLCGPDITDAVLAVLRDMKKDYDGLSPAAKAAACDKITDWTSPKTAINAWDIHGLSPSNVPGKGDEFDENTDDWVHTKSKTKSHFKPWLTGIDDACAVPRPRCAATVEFLGTCQHAQIVNYVQWGFMSGLCGQHEKFVKMLAHYQTAKMILSLGGSRDTRDPEDTMVTVGESYEKALEDQKDNNAAPPDDSSLREFVKKRVQGSSRPEAFCKLSCPVTDAQRARIKATINGYHWNGMPGHPY